MAERVLLSRCLAGEPCRWDGRPGKKLSPEKASRLLATSDVVLFCPECAGGLPTPREPAEIEPGKTAADVLEGNGRVMTSGGRDVTAEYLRGARAALSLCRHEGISRAVLKAKSPSCGCHQVYSGRFDGKLVPGRGVTAELLARSGIKVCDESDAFGDN